MGLYVSKGILIFFLSLLLGVSEKCWVQKENLISP